MIVEYIRYVLKDHAPEDLTKAYELAGEQLRSAPECLGYELTHCGEDGACFILRITWQSAQAHMQGFRKGAHFPPFLQCIRPFVSEIAEMRHYSLTDITWMRAADTRT